MTLLHGDALHVLDTIPDESVEALITDPPWGVGYYYRGDNQDLKVLSRKIGVRKAFTTAKKLREGTEEKTDTPEAYWDWLRPIYTKAVAKVRPGGLIAIWQAAKYIRYAWDWFGEDIHIIATVNTLPLAWPKSRIIRSWTPIYLSWKKGASPLIPRDRERPKDVIINDTHTDIKTRSYHPLARMPSECVALINRFCPKGTVLDPFMGSGSFGLAAVLTGRSYIGIEIREDYYQAAKACIQLGRKSPDARMPKTLFNFSDVMNG